MKRPLLLLILAMMLLPLVAHAQSDAALLDGLLAWWSFEEPSGTRYDSHNNNDLSELNTVGFTTGVQGTAASLVAANNEWLNTNIPFINMNYPVSVSGWLYMSALPSAGTISFLRNSSGGVTGMWLTVNSAGQYSPIGSALCLATDTLSASRWYMLTAVWNGPATNQIDIYVDGASAGSCISARTAGPNQTSIANSLYTTGSNIFVDETAVWQRALDADEVAALWNYSSGMSYTDAVVNAEDATRYESQLPSGGRGLLTMSATAGEVGTISILAALLALALFDTLRDMFRRARATK